MPLFRGRKDLFDVKPTLGGLIHANAPDFIDDRIPWHDLFSKKCFRREGLDWVHRVSLNRSMRRHCSLRNSLVLTPNWASIL